MIDQQFFSTNKKAVLSVLLLVVLLIAVAFGFIFYKKIVGNNKAVPLAKDPNANILEMIKDIEVKEVRSLDSSDHLWGNDNAPVQIIFYGDFDCPFSAAFYDTLEKVKQEYKEKIKIGFRHYPAHTASALLPALVVECAAEQNKFWEMYSRLFIDKKNENMDIEQFNKDAKDIGLQFDKFKECVESEKYLDKIQSQLEEGRVFNVNGTPTVFVGKEQLSGAIPWDNYKDQNGQEQEGLKSIIEKHLSVK